MCHLILLFFFFLTFFLERLDETFSMVIQVVLKDMMFKNFRKTKPLVCAAFAGGVF